MAQPTQMISLTYKITCDCCGGEKSRILDIPYVTVIDRDNAGYIFKLLTPALPNKWLVQKPKKEGEPDKIFCSVECKRNSEMLNQKQAS